MNEITEPGIYRTRNNRIATVSDIENASTWEDNYPISGAVKGVPDRKTWTKEGTQFKDFTSAHDLVEYLDPKTYPEEYL